ncbi:MAG: SPFH domain-containing protein [bacterium]|nr:SPFH domain-containing protein [bacterium]
MFTGGIEAPGLFPAPTIPGGFSGVPLPGFVTGLPEPADSLTRITILLSTVVVLWRFVARNIFVIVHQENRAVIERFGKFNRVLKSGLYFILPFGIEEVRVNMPVWQMTMPLFPSSIQIDFKDGGSAAPVGAEAWLRIFSPDTEYSVDGDTPRNGVFRALYGVANWRTATQAAAEHALRGYLGTQLLEDILQTTDAQTGFDLLTLLAQHQGDELKKVFRGLGFEVLRITVQDFNLGPEVLAARRGVMESQRQADATIFQRRTRSQETMGAVVQMVADAVGKTYEETQQWLAQHPEQWQQVIDLATKLVLRQMSVDGKALHHFVVEGFEPLVGGISTIAELIRGGTGPTAQGNGGTAPAITTTGAQPVATPA